jgi:pyruvate/2-oxoglutarate/acetoin dehydrogenase E1 component
MKTFKHSLFVIALMFCTFTAKASDGMEEYFYSSGKIKVVVAVSAVVMIGLLYAVIRVDRRVSKLEKKLNSNK